MIFSRYIEHTRIIFLACRRCPGRTIGALVESLSVPPCMSLQRTYCHRCTADRQGIPRRVPSRRRRCIRRFQPVFVECTYIRGHCIASRKVVLKRRIRRFIAYSKSPGRVIWEEAKEMWPGKSSTGRRVTCGDEEYSPLLAASWCLRTLLDNTEGEIPLPDKHCPESKPLRNFNL